MGGGGGGGEEATGFCFTIFTVDQLVLQNITFNPLAFSFSVKEIKGEG